MSTPLVRRVLRALVGLLLAPVAALIVAAILTPLPPELVVRRPGTDSIRFYDRGGALLREVRADDASKARWVSLEETGKPVEYAVLAAEDARFFAHPGVDPLAILRAAWSDVRSRRIVSGASTITMQLARLLRPHPRTFRGKLQEAALALRIEASLSKRDILEAYLNRAPFGESTRGIDAAARTYFDKRPAQLSLAEAATLAGLLRGPAVYAPRRHPERAIARRDVVLSRMRAEGAVSDAELAQAVAEPMDLSRAAGAFGAPHLVQALSAGSLPGSPAGARDVTTTIDRKFQTEIEHSVRTVVHALAGRNVTAASVVVVENATGDVLAYVGSPEVSDDAHLGQNDGARARRQPGSTLKPFVYGLAMERLGFDAATIVPDVELRLDVPGGIYAPANYDERFHGPVRVREALGSSLNVPAVWTAEQLGAVVLVERLRALGFASLTADAEHYGVGLALGDGEVTLLELAGAYAALARGGQWRPLRFVRGAPVEGPRTVMPGGVARALTDVLRDPGARRASFGEGNALDMPFDVAAKTGTSKGFRDNWTVGFTSEVTVAVWAGNFDGSPMENVSGITGAGPIFRAAMEAASRRWSPRALRIAPDDPDLVDVLVCPLSGGAPTAACGHGIHEWARRGGPAREPCAMHESVAIDRRSGLRARPGASADDSEVLTFERFDAIYAAWAARTGRPIAPEGDPRLSNDNGGAVPGAVRIGYPHDGARFVIDPDRPASVQTVAVRVEAPPSSGPPRVRVDGRLLDAPVGGPTVRWQIARGTHRIVAEAPGFPPSEVVTVRVD